MCTYIIKSHLKYFVIFSPGLSAMFTKNSALLSIEDIAEVFSVFITADNKPTGDTIADKKVLLMYDSAELVAFRNYTRDNITLRGDFELPEPGSWRRATTFGSPTSGGYRY